jgi:hypothetical protein
VLVLKINEVDYDWQWLFIILSFLTVFIIGINIRDYEENHRILWKKLFVSSDYSIDFEKEYFQTIQYRKLFILILIILTAATLSYAVSY